MFHEFILDLVFLLGVSLLFAIPLKFLQLGTLLGFFLAGTLLGPSGLGRIDNPFSYLELSEIGIALLLFSIGSEMKISRIWSLRKYSFGLGGMQMLLSSLCFLGLLSFFDLQIHITLILAFALAFSSTAYVLQTLNEKKLIKTDFGRLSFLILLAQDICVIPLLLVLGFMQNTESSLFDGIVASLGSISIFVICAIIFSKYILDKLLILLAKSSNNQLFTLFSLLLVLCGAYLGQVAGLSFAMGAFVAGICISHSQYRHQLAGETLGFRNLFLGLFFMAIGLITDVGYFASHFLEVVGLCLAIMLIKIFTIYTSLRIFGIKHYKSLGVSLSLSQSSEFALLVFSSLASIKLLSFEMSNILICASALTMVFTPFAIRIANRLIAKDAESPKPQATEKSSQAHVPVFIVGYGRVGEQVAKLLEYTKTPFIAVEKRLHLIEKASIPTNSQLIYGDVSQTNVLLEAGILDAKIVVLAINNGEQIQSIIAKIRQVKKHMLIIARGKNSEECAYFHSLGADFAICETIETSMELAKPALFHLPGVSGVEVVSILDAFRKAYYSEEIKTQKIF